MNNAVDPNTFRELYPQFSELSDAMINILLQTAQMYLPMDCFTSKTIELLIYETAAHLAQIKQSGLVGRISSATQGSVSVSAEMPNATRGSSWWLQTPFGSNVWQLIAGCYGFEYISPDPCGIFETWRM